MTLADATIYCGIAYYSSGGCSDTLRRTARICLRRLGPGKAKALRLLLVAEHPGEVLAHAIETLQSLPRSTAYDP